VSYVDILHPLSAISFYSVSLHKKDTFINTNKVRSIAPIAVVMLHAALAYVCWRSIWTESGEPVFKI